MSSHRAKQWRHLLNLLTVYRSIVVGRSKFMTSSKVPHKQQFKYHTSCRKVQHVHRLTQVEHRGGLHSGGLHGGAGEVCDQLDRGLTQPLQVRSHLPQNCPQRKVKPNPNPLFT